ncbi:MAG: hypothetical protein RLZ62_1830 [Bacteroidota bacterium]
MNSSYRTLFSIRIRHPYYSDGWCRDITMTPTGGTRILMRKHRLIWKAVQGNYMMLTDESRQETQKIPLYFLLNSTNPFFLNFTDHPLSRPLRKLYFHNFSVSYSEDGLSVLGSSHWIHPAAPEFQDYSLPEHVIREVAPGNLGLVDLHVKPSSESTSYLITLQPRSTVWRYWLVNQDESSFADIEVYQKDTNLPLAFQTGLPRTLANGDPATPLVVSVPASSGQVCSERHTLRPVLQLTLKQGLNKSKKVVMNLPAPDYRQITTESADSGLQLFSDMYVYFFKPNFF